MRLPGCIFRDASGNCVLGKGADVRYTLFRSESSNGFVKSAYHRYPMSGGKAMNRSMTSRKFMKMGVAAGTVFASSSLIGFNAFAAL
jgi:hypothetical protein